MCNTLNSLLTIKPIQMIIKLHNFCAVQMVLPFFSFKWSKNVKTREAPTLLCIRGRCRPSCRQSRTFWRWRYSFGLFASQLAAISPVLCAGSASISSRSTWSNWWVRFERSWPTLYPPARCWWWARGGSAVSCWRTSSSPASKTSKWFVTVCLYLWANRLTR